MLFEQVGNRGVDILGLENVSVSETASKCFGGDVDEFHLSGRAHEDVRNSTGRRDSRYAFDDVANRFKFADVQRCDDIDTRLEKFVDVLPTVYTRRTRGVERSEIVNEHDIGSPGNDPLYQEAGVARLRLNGT